MSVDLAARASRERLGVPLELVVFDTAGKSVDAVTSEQADIGFFAIDPKRGAGIRFTAPYVLIEGCYLVRDDSPLTRNEEVDRAGHRVVVGKGSAYDLYLTRELKQARDRARAELAGGGRHLRRARLRRGRRREAAARGRRRGATRRLRLLPGRFMVIQQAMGCPQGPRRGGARGAGAPSSRR